MKRFLGLFITLASTFLFWSNSSAQANSTYGMDLRLREEHWEDVFDLDTLNVKDEDFFRLRISLWGKWDFNQNLGAYLKLTSEPKYYMSSFSSYNHGLNPDEIVFDNLYLDVKGAFDLPVDLRIGRQNLVYGDGFLIVDGAPGSGDRTSYFNAAKATWRINEKHSIDFVYIDDPKTDTFLPSIHPTQSGPAYEDNKLILNPSHEKAVVVYGNNAINENIDLEPYYIYKQEAAINSATPELGLNTVGARAVFKRAAWQVKGEFAHQFGEYEGGRERTGNGGTLFVNRRLEDALWTPQVEAGVMYLSGDDPATSANEGWDPLFSRWCGPSKLYCYTFTKETGVFKYWTNLQMFRVDAKLNFTDDTNLMLWYNYLRADKLPNSAAVPAALFSNNGRERGHLWQSMLKHKFSEKIDGSLVFEYFLPGDFYSSNAVDALFFAWQLQMRI